MMSKCSRLPLRSSVMWIAAAALVTLMFITTYWDINTADVYTTTMDTAQLSDRVKEDFQRRQDHYMDACAVRTDGRVGVLFVDETSGLAVCHTPKVGCTFWKRIMTFLRAKGNRWKTPFEIDRFSVHHAPTVKISYKYDSEYVKDRISNLTRVVFGRDPYSRLWSSYVDKIILPDSWKDFGLGIYRYRNLGNVKCPLHITFEDFLHFALYKTSDAHWKPLYTFCNPCALYPKYIGKMETFSRDVTYILNESGLGHLLDEKTKTDHVEDEISILTDYHFKIHASREINQMCLTITGLAERLWRAFQLNGYISLSEKFPEKSLNKSVRGVNFQEARNIVTKVFVDHYRNNPKTDWKLQRQWVLENEYKHIPLRLREDISKIYKHDFELFEYEQYPKFIFSEKEISVIRMRKTTEYENV